MTDPALREIMVDESLVSPSLHQVLDGLNRCLPDLPVEVRAERADMARQLMTHVYAERERALAEGTPTPRQLVRRRDRADRRARRAVAGTVAPARRRSRPPTSGTPRWSARRWPSTSRNDRVPYLRAVISRSPDAARPRAWPTVRSLPDARCARRASQTWPHSEHRP